MRAQPATEVAGAVITGLGIPTHQAPVTPMASMIKDYLLKVG